MFFTIRKSKIGSMYGNNIESDRSESVRNNYFKKLIDSLKNKDDFKKISEKSFEANGYRYSKGEVF